MPVPSTVGSNINQYPQATQLTARPGGVLYPISVLFGANSVPSTVSCPYPVSFVSAAAGVWTFTGPTGVMMVPETPVIVNNASNASACGVKFWNVSPVSGTMTVLWVQENASGTSVTGVNPASGDRLNFAIWVHSMLDGGAI